MTKEIKQSVIARVIDDRVAWCTRYPCFFHIRILITACLLVFLLQTRVQAVQGDNASPIRLEFHSSEFSSRELLELAGSRTLMRNIEELPSILNRLYESLTAEGYPLAKLDSVVSFHNEKEKILKLYFDISKPVRFYENESDTTQEKEIRLYGLIVRVDEILDELTDTGYPFSSVTIVPVDVGEEDNEIAVRFDFRVEKRFHYRIKRVEFPGARLTGSRLLSLESKMRRGDEFSRSRLERAIRRLEKLPYIDYVGNPQLEETGTGLLIVHIPVTEKRVNRISGVLSSAPGQDKPTGELKLTLGNILGTGRKLKLEWSGLDAYRRGILVGYTEPWILGYPWHASVELEQWMEDTLSATTRYKLAIEWEPADRLFISGSVTDEHIAGNDSNAMSVSSRALWREAGIRYDRFDQEWNPDRGYNVGISTASALRRWDDPGRSSSGLRREKATAASVLPLVNKLILYTRLTVHDVSGSGVILEELIRLGGAESVRGYEEASIFARGAGWGAIELRWRPDGESYFGLFGDAGYIYREDSRTAPRKGVPVSFGLTAGMLTRAGRFGLDLGLASGEPLQNARLHIRLEGWF
ncbi:BamA/TamA family outer membrane protein [bacterium]|nr:BamA/TamA family outer membrane protein [bacterium]